MKVTSMSNGSRSTKEPAIRTSFKAAALLLVAIGLPAGNACAQTYPNKPVRIVVAFAPGGTVDVLARLIAPRLSDAFRQPVIVENRPGAGGIVGADAVAKSDPDGHTLLLMPNSLAIAPSLYRKLPFDTLQDFAPVVQLIATNLILVGNPRVLPATSVREFIALAKARPGALNYGSAGVTDTLQLTMELLKISTGIDVVPIMYKGVGPLNTALLAGEIELAIIPLSASLGAIKAGTLRALGVTSPRRSAALPDVPTIAEAGVPGFESTGWQGLFAPAKTPRAIVERIQREASKAVNTTDVRERLLASGQEPVEGTAEEFEAKFRGDIAKFVRIVKEARIPFQD